MANQIYLGYISRINNPTAFPSHLLQPLAEDPSIEFESQTQELKSMVPGFLQKIVDIMNMMRNLSAAGGGTASVSWETFMNLPIWSGTSPVKFGTKLLFYTKTNAKTDVWDPIMGIASNAILSYATTTGKNTDSVITPGISMHAYGKIKAAKGAAVTNVTDMSGTDTLTFKELANITSIVTVLIPGVIYLDYAMILSAKPTFSKQVTESGFPLWGEIAIDVRSIGPATNYILEQSNLTSTVKGNLNTKIMGEVLEGQG